MTKLPNLFAQNPLVISQGRHTQGWGTMSASVAIDFAYTGDLISPFDGCRVELHNNSNQGKQSYFSLILPDGSTIICVHGYPVRTGTFAKGEVIGKCRWHHWHLSMVVNGQLDCILSYIDRSNGIMTQAVLYGGETNHPDGRWETYPDKHLNIGVTAPQPIPMPQADVRFFTTKKGGWRSEIINEIIKAGIWTGTWQKNLELFNRLNPVSPSGGWPAGSAVRVKEDPQPIQQVPVSIPTPAIETPTMGEIAQQIPQVDSIRVSEVFVQPEPEISIQEQAPIMDHLPQQPVQSQEEFQGNTEEVKSVEPKPAFTFPERLKSRKLWTAIVACSYAITSVYKPELQEVLTQIWTIALGYIGIEGINDIINPKK